MSWTVSGMFNLLNRFIIESDYNNKDRIDWREVDEFQVLYSQHVSTCFWCTINHSCSVRKSSTGPQCSWKQHLGHFVGFSEQSFLSSSQNRGFRSLQDALLLLKSIRLLHFASALCACVVLRRLERKPILKPWKVKVWGKGGQMHLILLPLPT